MCGSGLCMHAAAHPLAAQLCGCVGARGTCAHVGKCRRHTTCSHEGMGDWPWQAAACCTHCCGKCTRMPALTVRNPAHQTSNLLSPLDFSCPPNIMPSFYCLLCVRACDRILMNMSSLYPSHQQTSHPPSPRGKESREPAVHSLMPQMLQLGTRMLQLLLLNPLPLLE